MALRTARRSRTTQRVALAAIPTAGLRAWWKGDSLASPPVNGGTLSVWSDSSNNGIALTAASGAAPIYRTTGAFLPNGKPVVEFTARNKQWMRATVANSGATTRFVVVRFKSISRQSLYSSSAGDEQYIDAAGLLSVDIPNVAALEMSSAASVTANAWQVVSFDTNGTNSHHQYLNGLPGGTSAVGGHATASLLDIGARGWNAAQFPIDGYIAEIVDYARVLTGVEQDQVHTYLQSKYAIESTSITPLAIGFLDFGFDKSEAQAFTNVNSKWEAGSAHQHAWLTSPTRLSKGHSERFEVHNSRATDIWPGHSTIRSLMCVADTNEGGTTAGSAKGYKDVYWAWSSYLPTSGSGDVNATVAPGFSQTRAPNYTHLFEIHERDDATTPGLSSLGEVSNHAIMIRNNQLQYRERCGIFSRTGGGAWSRPSYNNGTPGNNGSNDQIPIPIVKPGGTNATMVMDAWLDVILHIRFAPDSTGLTEIWARQAGQAFTAAPNLSISGPTHKVLVSNGVTSTTAGGYGGSNPLCGCYMEVGLYTGSSSWSDSNNGAHVHIVDELRRYGSIADARRNWG